MKRFLALSLLLLSACASNETTYQHYLSGKGLESQLPERFQHCHGYGCKFITPVRFTQDDWSVIEAVFTPPPATPAAEREAIKTAIGLFEQRVGAQTGTNVDIHGTFMKVGDKQLDCVDESTNTTIYLSLLQQKGLMRFHRVEGPSMRLPLLHAGRWPHQTAVITRRDTGEFFAVDSWFHDNGAPAEIVTLKTWKEGWRPNTNGDSSN
ncbi:MAG: hypothetical protein H6861_07345 [Rhodospirillales bacterium]|nr:hypothetical protein [Rhodospirillales bacterium]